jgi:hypothetical protein
MVRIPDPVTFQRRWRELDVSGRRRIMRAVNRGVALDDRAEAALAVVLARRQRRFWRTCGLASPIVGIIVALLTGRTGTTPVLLLANTVVASLGVGLLSLWWFRRAIRAEERNLIRVERGGRR